MLIILYFLFMNSAMPTISFHAREVFISILSLIIFIWIIPVLLRFFGIPIPKMKDKTKEKIYNGIYKVIEFALGKIWNLGKWVGRKVKYFLPWVFRISKKYFVSQGLKTWQCNVLAILVAALALLIII